MIKPQNKKAFILVELAVASFVIAIAILGVLAIAKMGEQAAIENEDRTRASLFADEVFTTLQLYSDQAAKDEDLSSWVKFWVDLSNGHSITQLNSVASNCWNIPTDKQHQLAIYGDGLIHTNVWIPAYPSFMIREETTPHNAMQYKLTVTLIDNQNELHTPSMEHTNQPMATISASLSITPGIYSRTYDAHDFFIIYVNPGRIINEN